MATSKTTVIRASDDVSPKVSVPSILLIVLAAVTAFVQGVADGDPVTTQSVILAVAGLITAVVGYFTPDRVQA